MAHSNLSRVASKIILSELPDNDKNVDYKDEFSGCLVDSFRGDTTMSVYIGTGSKVVSPTMFAVDEYDENGKEKAWAKARESHIEDMAKVLEETIKYKEMLLKEVFWCDEEIKKLKEG